MLFAAVALGVVVMASVLRQTLGLGFYFDEMWRVDLIGSQDWYDRYRTQNGPLPPGWLALMKILTLVIPSDPWPLRIGQLVAWAVMLALVGSLLGRRLPMPRRGWVMVALVAPAFWPMMSTLVSYVNNYVVEMVATATVLWLAERDDCRPTPRLCAALVSLPLFALGGLFVVPGVLATMLMAARQPDLLGSTATASGRTNRRSWATLVAALAMSAVAALVYLTMYRPVRDEALDRFWARDGLRFNPGGWRGWLDNHWFHLRHGLLPRELVEVLPPALTALIVATAGAMAVVGLVVMWRAWRPWTIVAVSAWALCTVASALSSWPSTLVRVNAAWAWMWPWSSVIGAAWLARWYAPRPRVGASAPLSVAPVAGAAPDTAPAPVAPAPTPARVCAVAALLFGMGTLAASTQLTLAPDANFARGLDEDLLQLQAQLRPGDAVISYHFMARFYVHHRLVNRAQTPVQLREQTLHSGAELYEGLAAWAASSLRRDATLWCVVVPEVGAADTERACRINPEGRRRVTIQGQRSTVIGWVPGP